MRRGRVSLVALFGVVALALFAFVLIFSRESLSSVGSRFMSALAAHDVDTLTKMTYLGDDAKPEDIRKKWDYAVNTVGKYYRFRWIPVAATQASENSAAIRIQVLRNSDSSGTYEENFQLPLVKVGSEWKVDVRGINREMFPGLPR